VAPWLQKQIKNLKSAVLATIIMFVLGRLLKVILRFVYVYFQVDEITYMLGNNPFGNLYLFGMGIVAYYAIKEEKVKEGILISMTAITVLSYLNSPWYLYWMFLAEVFILLSSQISLKLPTGIGKIVTFLSNVSFDLYLVHLGVISRLADTEIQDKYGSLCFVVCTVIATVLCSILVYYVDQLILKRLFQHIGK
jgi:peptidoglycan/LPS O-acetylase OafA/YrhL